MYSIWPPNSRIIEWNRFLKFPETLLIISWVVFLIAVVILLLSCVMLLARVSNTLYFTNPTERILALWSQQIQWGILLDHISQFRNFETSLSKENERFLYCKKRPVLLKKQILWKIFSLWSDVSFQHLEIILFPYSCVSIVIRLQHLIGVYSTPHS